MMLRKVVASVAADDSRSMDHRRSHVLVRIAVAAALPGGAFALQWLFWKAIQPYVWFLFFPAVFLSAWIGGLAGALVATVLSTALVWYFFIPPEVAWFGKTPFSFVSAGLFIAMGALFGYTQERVQRANRRTAEALAEARTANERLRHANEKITQLYDRTLELDQLKTNFFANVSHELRTPLTLILGPVGRRLAAKDLSDAERHELEIVERNARLLYRHVSDLLDVAKIEAGAMQMQYARIDLAGLVRLTASHFDVVAGERRIGFGVETPDALPAEVDAEKVQRVLLNLLSNAFKFVPDGGKVDVNVVADGAQAVVRVFDNGPGVPDNMRAAVFERFRQVEGGAERRFGGTGLGLAIVKEFVDLHGGTVHVDTAPGGGAQFTVRLPLAAPPGTELTAAPSGVDPVIDRQIDEELRPHRRVRPPPAVARDAPLILVVEDNSDMNAFIADTLGRHFQVATAFDGEEGLDKALALHPDLIVSDVMMPRMTGEQMAEALRARADTRPIPIVMLTAKIDDALRVRMLSAGVRAYIAKPFSAAELLAGVTAIITERRLVARQLRESERLVATVANASPALIWMAGQDKGCTWFNEPWLRYTGRSLPESLGTGWQTDIHPDDNQRVVQTYGEAFEARRAFALEFRLRRHDGEYRWIINQGQPRFDEAGTFTGYIGSVMDISDRKRAEQEIRTLNVELERRVAERTAQLEASNKEMEAFSYSVSHDLKAPLRAIDGYGQLLEEQCAADLDAEGRIFLRNIRSGAGQMRQLIDDLLDYSRLDRVQATVSAIDLQALVQKVLAERAHEIEQLGARVEAAVPAVVVCGQAEGLNIALRNLLDNALKFAAAATPPVIGIGVRDEAERTVLWVRDNGIGFDMRFHDRIFEIFSRLQRAEDYPGTGVGLALVRKSIQRMGGSVRAESSPGQGATFFLEIPK